VHLTLWTGGSESDTKSAPSGLADAEGGGGGLAASSDSPLTALSAGFSNFHDGVPLNLAFLHILPIKAAKSEVSATSL
jgi:hypothetical protein